MTNIDVLRNKLYTAITEGDAEVILTVSRELDHEIVHFMKSQLAYGEQIDKETGKLQRKKQQRKE